MQESYKIARDNLINKKEVNKNFYDKTANPIELHVGDKVLIKNQNKRDTLSRNWTGPFEITHVHDNENITIKRGKKDYRIHKNNVKKYFEN